MSKKSILITGVDEGIGYETALYFLRRGWIVFGTMLDEVYDETLFPRYQEFVPLCVDVTDQKSIDKAVKVVEKQVGDGYLSCLLNNAALTSFGHIAIESIESMQKVMDVNYWGVIRMIRAFLPVLGADDTRQGPKGRIINSGSVSAVIPFPTGSSYAVTKAALMLLSRTLTVELNPIGVAVTYLDMGPVKTKMVSKAYDLMVEAKESHCNSPFASLYKSTAHLFETLLHNDSDSEPSYIAAATYKLAMKKNPPAYSVVSNFPAKYGSLLIYYLPYNWVDRLVGVFIARAHKQVDVDNPVMA